IADTAPPVDAIAAPKAAATLARAAGSHHDVLAARHGSADIIVVAGDEAEAVDQPSHDRNVLHTPVHDAVREGAQAIVDGDREHASVVRERAAVVSDDQRGARAVEVLEAVHGVAVIALEYSPVAEPQAERNATRRHHPPRRSIAPEERPAPTPIMRM